MTILGGTVLVLVLAAPLAAALLVPAARRPLTLLPWAAVPGFAAVLLAPPGASIELPALVLGLHLRIDRIGAIFLGFGALLWCLAGSYARSYMKDARRSHSFALFWLLALAGSLGTFIAADVVTFYVMFSAMSLATYGLVVHDRTASARRAGLIYIVLAVIGETALVASLMVAAGEADSLDFGAIRAALAIAPSADAVLLGLLVGFGIKAGLVPLHLWLPLAHPEAPTPASAVLSGVIVKAGIIGLIRLLPGEGLSPAWGEALTVIGLATAYFGIVAGLLQANAKAVLAYSTLSQMGIVVTVLASGLDATGSERGFDVAALYAAHHGLAKGALFLAVGVVATSTVRALRPVLAVTALTALAVAGLPLSGGALAKLAIKDTLGTGWTGFLVTLSAIGTTLVMLRFLWVVAPSRRASPDGPAWGLTMPWAATVLAALAVPWAMFPGLTGQPVLSAMAPDNLWAASWPILLAGVMAAIARWRWPGAQVTIPPGDLVVGIELLLRRVDAARAQPALRLHAPRALAMRAPLAAIDRAERALRRWRVSGPALVIVATLIAIVLAR